MKRSRALAATLVLGAGFAATVTAPGRAFAGYTVCRTDPTVTLSNGRTLTLWTDISTDASHVSSVTYVLHIPAGLRVTSVEYDQSAGLETFTWAADQTGNKYASEVTVATGSLAGTVPVTSWVGLPQGKITYSVSGTSGQTLTISWKS